MTATVVEVAFVVSVLVLAVGSVSSQNDALAIMRSRMNAIEGRVESLNSRVASLESRLSQSGGENPEPEATEFKIVNITRAEDQASNQVVFTLHYQAEDPPQFLLANNAWTLPMEVEHDAGPVTFSVPSDESSPVMYVLTQSNTFYSLTLFTHAGGPTPDRPEQFPNVIMTTSPDKAIKFQEGEQEAEITITTHVTGTGSRRQVRKESLAYYAYALSDDVVDYIPYTTLYNDYVGDNHHHDNDNAINDDSSGLRGQQQGRLRPVLLGEREGNQTRDVVKLDVSRENSGVLFVQKGFEFSCQACILYSVSVSRPLLYYVDNGQYVQPQGTLVAYKDIYNFGPDREGPRYFRFLRMNESEAAHTSHQTCRQGHSCSLQCSAFGDYPEAYFFLFNRRVYDEGVYYDQVGNRLTDPGAQHSAPIRAWSAQVGMEAYSYIHFDDVRAEHAGRYVCRAMNSRTGMALVRTFVLTVE